MKNKIKTFGLSLGIMAMSFTFFLGNPSNSNASMEEDWICCQSLNGPGCTDKGGGFWPTDIRIEGGQGFC
jgi:hypothetical protein